MMKIWRKSDTNDCKTNTLDKFYAKQNQIEKLLKPNHSKIKNYTSRIIKAIIRLKMMKIWKESKTNKVRLNTLDQNSLNR